MATEQVIKLTNDVVEIIKFYDDAMTLMDATLMPIIIQRNHVKFKPFTLNLMRETAKEVGSNVVISMGKSSFYFDFSSPVGIFFSITIDAAFEADDGHIRIDAAMATRSWAKEKKWIINKRMEMQNNLPNVETICNNIAELRRLQKALENVPREFYNLIK